MMKRLRGFRPVTILSKFGDFVAVYEGGVILDILVPIDSLGGAHEGKSTGIEQEIIPFDLVDEAGECRVASGVEETFENVPPRPHFTSPVLDGMLSG